MANKNIQNEFIEGVYEIFSTIFNDGVESGINLYLMSEKTKTNIYGENKYKMYNKPIMLVAQSYLTPKITKNDVETIEGIAEFIVPLKSLLNHNIDLSSDGLELLRKGVIELNGTFYSIDNIVPKSYVADVFLLYSFKCTEEKNLKSVQVVGEE